MEKVYHRQTVRQQKYSNMDMKQRAMDSLGRLFNPYYYECDNLKDYIENIEKIKDERLVLIDGLWVESILEHESRDPNIGYIILRDISKERMKFLVSRKYNNQGYSGLDEESWKVFRSLKINDDVEASFYHEKITYRNPFLIPERTDYSQRLISLHRDDDRRGNDEETHSPEKTYTLDEILVPVKRE